MDGRMVISGMWLIQKTNIIAITVVAVITTTTTTRCIPCFKAKSHHLIESACLAVTVLSVWRLFGIGRLAGGREPCGFLFHLPPACWSIGVMLTLQNHQQGRIKLMREIFSGYYYYSQRDIIYSMYSVLYSMCLAGKLPIIPGTAASNTKNGIVCKLNGACSRHRAAMVQD